MGLSSAITILENVFMNSSFFSTFLVPQLIALFTSLLLITRDTGEWKKLAFPVAVGWSIFGMPMGIVIMMGTGLIMVIDTLSVRVIGNSLNAVGSWANIKDRKDRNLEKKQRDWDKVVKRMKAKDRFDYMSSGDYLKDKELQDWRKMKGRSAGFREMQNELKGNQRDLNVLGYSKDNPLMQSKLSQLAKGQKEQSISIKKLIPKGKLVKEEKFNIKPRNMSYADWIKWRKMIEEKDGY